jgi:hypothetical protein
MTGDDDEFGAVEPARGRRRRAAPPAPPETGGSAADAVPCPFQALGQRDGVYYLTSASGELRVLGVRDLTPNGILSLCDGDAGWLVQAYPKIGDHGRPTGEWAPRAAAAGIMRACAAAGLWSSEIAVRGVGVWPHGTGVLVHAGDAIWDGAEGWRRAGVRLGDVVYPAAPRIVRPADVPAGEAEARALWEHLRLWPVKTPGGRLLLYGWIMIGLLGAAPRWRPHVLISAGRGSGKTTLASLASAVHGPQGLYTNNFSEAGLRQAPSGQGRAIVLDEAEGAEPQVEQAIRFIRQLSDAGGAQMLRGSGDGTAKRSEAAAPVCLVAINAPALLPQDRSRITEIELGQLPEGDTDGAARAEAAIAWARRHSPALRARAVGGWGRFREALGLVRSLLIGRGADGRQADQLGALVAAGAMMWSDAALDGDSAELLVERVLPLLATMRAEDEEESDARQCLQHLLTSQVEHWDGGAKSTIGRLVQDALGPQADGRQRAALRTYGIRLEREALRVGGWEMAGPVVAVANGHRGLLALFDRSRWPQGGHRRALMRLPGAVATPPISFDGIKSRAIAIGPEWLPRGLDEDEAPPG